MLLKVFLNFKNALILYILNSQKYESNNIFYKSIDKLKLCQTHRTYLIYKCTHIYGLLTIASIL